MNQDIPHRRLNPLTGEWVLVSPHRAKRPWKGKVEKVLSTDLPAYLSDCQLCPRNERASGIHNPDYESVFAFDNDFPAILESLPEEALEGEDSLFQAEAIHGKCLVICFSPRHDLSLARMDSPGVLKVIQLWKNQYVELGATHRWVQVFENKGELMGCSNPHPHGQIWASGHVPTLVEKERIPQQSYFKAHGSPLLLDYARKEMESGERVVVSNAHWVAVVPWWATWPFEILLLPLFPVQRMEELDSASTESLADILRHLLIRYDNLFETSFPYSMGWHPAPYEAAEQVQGWQLHTHFYPPLLRSATVRKFMVGYEMMGEPQRDLTAEQAAVRLRELDPVHYLDRGT